MKVNTTIIVTIILLILVSSFLYQFTKKKPTVEHTRQILADNFDNKEIIKTENYYKERFDNLGLSNHWLFFKSHLKKEIQVLIESTTESRFKLGQSKIGGQPDLPKNTEWFKEDNGQPLSFIAQINLAELTYLDEIKELPASGCLYFFYSADQSAWGFDPKDKDKFKVFFYEGDVSNLERRGFPETLDESARYKPCKLSFNMSASLPNWGQDYVADRLNKDEMDKYFDITEEEGSNKLLGHADNIQNPMELECELVTNGLYCGDATGYNDPKAKALEKNKDNWILLFQVDSNYKEAGMMWGDMGRLYFWIKKEDLTNKRFDKCWLISQCS